MGAPAAGGRRGGGIDPLGTAWRMSGPLPSGAVVVRLPNWLGDVVLAEPAVRLLRAELEPMHPIVLAARTKLAGLADATGMARYVVDVEEAGSMARLRSARPAAVALFTNSLSTAWWAFRTRAGCRIGWARGGRSPLLTHGLTFHKSEWQTPAPEPVGKRKLAVADVSISARPMAEYYLHVAAQTITALQRRSVVWSDEDRIPRLDPPPSAITTAQHWLAELGLSQCPIVGFQAGAAYGSAKRYPAELLASALDEISRQQPGARFLPIASPAELELVRDVQKLVQHATIVVPNIPVDLPALLAVMKRLAVLVANDSGPMHLAVAAETPCVAVFGPTDWVVTGHEGSPGYAIVRNSPACAPCLMRECPLEHHQCMRNVDPAMVAQRALELGRWT